MVEGENIVEEIYKWTNISYYLALFIYDNLRVLGLPSIEYETAFGAINEKFNTICSSDIKEMSAINDLVIYKSKIDSSEFLDDEERTALKQQIADLEKYEIESLNLIKTCNEFVMKLSGNSLKISLYSAETIVARLTESGNEMLVQEYNKPVQIELNIPVAKGINLNKFSMPIKYKPTMPNIPISRRDLAVQAAGSYKANKPKKHRITKKQMSIKKGKKTKCRKGIKKCHKYTKKRAF